MNHNASIRSLRYFEALATELNYRRAAERLFISQPALSAAIRQLEQLMGNRLFDRDTRSVSLTRFGVDWLPFVRAALREVDLAFEAATSLVDNGQIRVGYLIGTGADLLFQLLEGVDSELPDLSIETTEFDFSDPSAGLASGVTDIALIRPPIGVKDLEMAVIAEESWVACLPRTHRFAGRSELSIDELLDEPLIVAPQSGGTWRDHWMAADVRHGRPANIAGEAATYEAEITLVSRGVGISFSTSSLSRLYDRPGIRFVPITDRPISLTTLAWKRSHLSISARHLLQYMLSRAPVPKMPE